MLTYVLPMSDLVFPRIPTLFWMLDLPNHTIMNVHLKYIVSTYVTFLSIILYLFYQIHSVIRRRIILFIFEIEKKIFST